MASMELLGLTVVAMVLVKLLSFLEGNPNNDTAVRLVLLNLTVDYIPSTLWLFDL